MPRPLLLLGLCLLAVAAVSPALEALAPCVQACADEGQDGPCAGDPCCSCCVHVRSVQPDRAVPADLFAHHVEVARTTAARPLAVAPRDILHVPKPASA